jgi:hypothetical protein
MTKQQTPNTKASCGRNDPAWKHKLNEIPVIGNFNQKRGEEILIYGESGGFLVSSRSGIKHKTDHSD